MSKIFKLAILALGISLFCVGAAIADPPPVEIPIDINIGTVLELTAVVKNISNDAVAPLSFNVAGVTTAAPWRVSDQYLDIEYTANTAKWGVRLITDNKTAWPAMVGNSIAPGANGTYEGDVAGTDDILSFGGIVNTGALDNPTMRASLGWQIYVDKVAKPADPADASFGGNPYSSAWAYLSDKTNNVANSDGSRKMNGAVPVLAGDEGIVTGATAGGDMIFNYALVAYGGIGDSLAQHPAMPGDPPAAKPANDTDGDGKYDAAVYMAARFASTDYADPLNPVNFVLPGGSYSAKLYVELMHE